jgi:ppGpp synthetase/RelA/SpoT-type nucleotidyltranferase
MDYSKSKIDRSGLALSKNEYRSDEEYIELEDIFDDYRKRHLEPLSETTMEIQSWLSGYDTTYYIAQRLKRKPQIIRKLQRLKVRLSQLQDIGGSRIIVQHNHDIDKLIKYLNEQISTRKHLKITRTTDYREKGRDDTGYRAVHLLIERDNLSLELQIRSRVQHYWSESIERTSVIYGHYLKEGDGDPIIIEYFKALSNAFYEIESGRKINPGEKLTLEQKRINSEELIRSSKFGQSFDSFVNEGIVKTLVEKEKRVGKGLNNWIFVFDWNSGAFIQWDMISKNPSDAIAAYVRYEKQYPSDQGFEVVLVGSSEVATVRQTHSHYFGIDSNSVILEDIDSSVIGFSSKIDLDIGARQILLVMTRKHFWGGKVVSIETLKNHFCKNIVTFEDSLSSLLAKGLLIQDDGVSLNLSRKSDIERYL